jgi:glucose-1-phosphatase
MDVKHEPDAGFDVLLFDLGGVLVHWAGVEGLVELSGGGLDPEEARLAWVHSPWVRAFEAGRCTDQEFAGGIIEELGLQVDSSTFLEHFLEWDRGPFPGALELLDQLRPRMTLACLSNNNPVHWARIRDEFGFKSRFDHTFLSHEMGLVKPDRSAYEYVLRNLGTAPGRVLFLDDNPECTRGAAEVGVETELVRGIEAVKKALVRRGVLPPTPDLQEDAGIP